MSLTSYITYIFAADTSSTTGAGKTGLAYSDFTAKQLIPGGTLASLTTENITTLGTFASPTSAAHIRIKEVNSAAPTAGWYEVQIHDTNMAWANRELMLGFSASGASIKPLRIDLQTLTITQDDSGSVLLAVSQPSVNFAELHVTGPMTADSFAIANNLQIDGTFSTVGFTINGVAPGAPSGLAIVGSAMTLTAAYDAAKTAATQTSVNNLPSAATIAAAVWNAVTSGLTTVGSIGKWIIDNLNATISSRATQTSVDGITTGSGNIVFTGANAVTITVTDNATPTPNVIPGAKVRLTLASQSQLQETNGSGIAQTSAGVLPALDDGTYTYAITAGMGYEGATGTIVVDATHKTFTVALVAITIPVPSTGQCTGTLLVVDPQGAAEPNATIYFRAKGANAAGYAYDSTVTSSISNGAGVVSRLFPSGSIPYQWRRGTAGNWTDFTTAATDGDTFNIDSGAGTP